MLTRLLRPFALTRGLPRSSARWGFPADRQFECYDLGYFRAGRLPASISVNVIWNPRAVRDAAE
jgi:hypothetical protein